MTCRNAYRNLPVEAEQVCLLSRYRCNTAFLGLAKPLQTACGESAGICSPINLPTRKSGCWLSIDWTRQLGFLAQCGQHRLTVTLQGSKGRYLIVLLSDQERTGRSKWPWKGPVPPPHIPDGASHIYGVWLGCSIAAGWAGHWMAAGWWPSSAWRQLVLNWAGFPMLPPTGWARLTSL